MRCTRRRTRQLASLSTKQPENWLDNIVESCWLLYTQWKWSYRRSKHQTNRAAQQGKKGLLWDRRSRHWRRLLARYFGKIDGTFCFRQCCHATKFRARLFGAAAHRDRHGDYLWKMSAGWKKTRSHRTNSRRDSPSRVHPMRACSHELREYSGVITARMFPAKCLSVCRERHVLWYTLRKNVCISIRWSLSICR